ncbi:MAG TPA: hypothetical protein DCX37_03205, partial [Firmicutes bacterium]|nr:hypothetical protein [Bacillota bacterium]
DAYDNQQYNNRQRGAIDFRLLIQLTYPQFRLSQMYHKERCASLTPFWQSTKLPMYQRSD